MPEYEKIAQTLKENDPPIPVAKVDATVANTLASRFEVSGYPTIKILKKGEAVEYDGERNEKGKSAISVGLWEKTSERKISMTLQFY